MFKSYQNFEKDRWRRETKITSVLHDGISNNTELYKVSEREEVIIKHQELFGMLWRNGNKDKARN